MQIVTLIAAPGGLQTALVEALRNAWGGGEARWLSRGEAAEFPVETVPGNQWDVWADLQAQGLRLPGNGVAEHGNVARGWRQQPAQHSNGG